MGIEETLAEKVHRRVLRWFWHVDRMDEGRWQRQVKAVTVEEHKAEEGLGLGG